MDGGIGDGSEGSGTPLGYPRRRRGQGNPGALVAAGGARQGGRQDGMGWREGEGVERGSRGPRGRRGGRDGRGASGRSGGAEGRRVDGLRGADVLSPKVGRALRFSLASGSPSPLHQR